MTVSYSTATKCTLSSHKLENNRRVIVDEPHHFEPWSSEESDTCVVTLVQRRCRRLFSSIYFPVCLVNKRLSLHPTGRVNLVASTSDSCIHTKAVSVERLANQRFHLRRDEISNWLDARH
ncbi:hypothetical protein TNCV_1459341 [Trichonephila clavipes]|nr:hypothetical protein TNCV_1459341 [Trichonephila clavipes]